MSGTLNDSTGTKGVDDNIKNNTQNESIACVIPAYNEEKHIAGVLDVLCGVTEFDQIIVVDDASTDGTPAVVREYCSRDSRVRHLRMPKNSGKGGAMVTGANNANSDLVVFLDADLIDLKRKHVLDLVEPVRNNGCSMTLGIFSGGRMRTDWAHRLTPFLTGQRCLRWSLYKSAPDLELARYGVEVALNLHAWHRKYRIANIPWKGVTHVMKPEKVGRFKGCRSYLEMYVEILKYVSKHIAKDRSAENINLQ